MGNTLTDAIDLLKKMSEKEVVIALEKIRGIKAECEKDERPSKSTCPHCKSEAVVRNGHKRNKQAYICRKCRKSFVETTKTAMFNSHSGEAVWKQVIKDTVDGVPIDDTADNLGLHHETVFNMRHKILFCLEQEEKNNPTLLDGICEADETYILENYKGKKLPENFWRGPRKHGAKAKKPGLSNEYICVCAGVERDGDAISVAVNRSVASKEDINEVFGDRVSEKTVIVTDGAKGYGVLEEAGKCMIVKAGDGNKGLYNINTVNNYHSFIKEREREARGYATKYLNRYNSLFSKVYRADKTVVDDIYALLCDMDNRSHTNIESQTKDLLRI